jgi:hypothetical protein
MGSARTSRAGDRVLAITKFRVLFNAETHKTNANVNSPE